MTVEAAHELWKRGKTREALALAWQAYDAVGGQEEKVLVAALLRHEPPLLTAARVADLTTLLEDSRIAPAALSNAGWIWLLRDAGELRPDDGPAAMAQALERSKLAAVLLMQDIVTTQDAEQLLTRVRRWLLLCGRRGEFPRLTAALIAQAALNGGAWPFEPDERTQLAEAGDFALAYLPPRPQAADAAYRDPVTRAVAQQYEAWPYPTWTRVMAAQPISLAARVAKNDPGGPDAIASPAEILIAGCGSGQQAALDTLRYPGDRITAVDLSAASLRTAAERCAALGLTGIDFRRMDLHEVAALGIRFDAVMCTGVLHHLPDPEAGWAALARAVKPGGVMRIMVYSRIARMRIAAVRRALGDLLAQTVDDDLLRAVRRRVQALPPAMRPRGRDFFSLAGVHDLLLHRHEDPFDIPRIRRCLAALNLRLIRFELPSPPARQAYREKNPHDPLQRDFAGWAAAEREDVSLFSGMYDFWCRKPA